MQKTAKNLQSLQIIAAQENANGLQRVCRGAFTAPLTSNPSRFPTQILLEGFANPSRSPTHFLFQITKFLSMLIIAGPMRFKQLPILAVLYTAPSVQSRHSTQVRRVLSL